MTPDDARAIITDPNVLWAVVTPFIPYLKGYFYFTVGLIGGIGAGIGFIRGWPR